MQTFLITGSDEKGRVEKFENLINKKISSLANNPDFLFLQTGESSIGIDEIRNLQNGLSRKPFQEKMITVLIKEAQNLTTEAQNCLLKTLEEPNPASQIFLTAPDTSWLLPTIVSRCQIIHLPLKSQIQIDEKESQKIGELLNSLLNSSPAKRFKIAEEEGIAKDRQSAILWLDKLTFVIRKQLLDLHQPATKDQSPPNILISQYLTLLRSINHFKSYLSANCNVRLTIENFLLLALSTPGVD